ncbi:MAG: Gfo/Idh/MocA family oxidoreductase [Firmicutes bacterium]|nr:Gfo/Idh/MocA family oxidoreductase [Bacillota bacterium]
MITNVGVIGTGFIGPAHVEALRRTGRVNVTAIADINEEIACAKAAELGILKAYGDYHGLLADPEIEVVHICTPNYLHYAMSKESLLACKHVICEKPFVFTETEGEELVALAKEKGLLGAIHLSIRFYPMVHQAREMVRRGDVGEIFAVNGSYQQDWLFYDTDYSWRLEPSLGGDSRVIADIGSHWFDTVEFITGQRVNRVLADFATFHKTRKKSLKPVETYSGKLLKPEDYAEVPITTEDYATVLLRFNGGGHGSFTGNQVAAGRKNRMAFEIYGSKCSLWYDSERPNELWIGHRDRPNEWLLKDPSLVYPEARAIISYPGGHNEGYPDTTKQMLIKVYDYLQAGGSASGTTPEFAVFEDGLRELQLCNAIVRSAQSESWVDI